MLYNLLGDSIFIVLAWVYSRNARRIMENEIGAEHFITRNHYEHKRN